MPKPRRPAVVQAAAIATALLAVSLLAGFRVRAECIGERGATREARAVDDGPGAPARPAPADDALAGSLRVRARVGALDVAYVADETEAAIRVVDEHGATIGTTVVDGLPSSLALLADGRLLVAVRDRAEVEVLSGSGAPVDPLRVDQRIAVPDEPVAITLTPDRGAALIVSERGEALTALDGRSLGRIFERHVPGRPRRVGLSGDGAAAIVVDRSGTSVTIVDLAAAKPSAS